MKYITILIAITISLKLLGTDFAPVGAKWYYDERFAFSGDVDYILYTCEKDTLINGILCRKIIKRHDLSCYYRPAKEFVYTKNDSVFFYDRYLDTFQLLYDFNAVKHNSWTIKFKDGNSDYINQLYVSVDSISQIVINSKTLKVLYIKYVIRYDDSEETSYNSTIIEQIGDIDFMFNFFPSMKQVCDINWSRGLRCYIDDELGTYHHLIIDSCDYAKPYTNINDFTNSNFTIFPNPSSGLIKFNGSISINKYKMFDIFGRIVKAGCVNNNQIEVTGLKEGLYKIQLFTSDSKIILDKVIIK